jgi:hypothetical protein
MRLHGQTFDVEALTEVASDDEARPDSARPSQGAAEEPEANEPEAPVADPPVEADPPLPDDDSPEPESPPVPAPTRPTTPAPSPAPEPSAPVPAPEGPTEPLREPAVDPFASIAPRGEPPTAEATPAPDSASDGAYGEAAPDSGERLDLFSAFLKTLPLAAKTFVAFSRLPAGPLGRVEFTLTIDETHKLSPITLNREDENAPPSLLEQAVLMNRQFLVSGRFQIPTSSRIGRARFALTATVQKRKPDDSDDQSSGGVRAFGLRGGTRPTGAYFTYFSGQHIELEMWRLP